MKRLPARATDDAALVERSGVRTRLAMGDYSNIKITRKEDIKLAEILFKMR